MVSARAAVALSLLVLGACDVGSSGDGGGEPPADGQGSGGGGGGGGDGSGGGSAGLEPGSLAVSWMHGSPSCAQNTDPELQVHAYNATTYIIRQNKCRTFEAPFVYVLVGTTSALVLDTGATSTATLRDTVRGLVGSRQLLAAHSHHHNDHYAGDSQFAGQPMTTVVGGTRAAVQAAFRI